MGNDREMKTINAQETTGFSIEQRKPVEEAGGRWIRPFAAVKGTTGTTERAFNQTHLSLLEGRYLIKFASEESKLFLDDVCHSVLCIFQMKFNRKGMLSICGTTAEYCQR